MRTALQIPVSTVAPLLASILEAQGIPPTQQNNERTRALALEAIALYREKAAPAGIIMEVTKEEFASVFHGAGRNDAESPVGPVSDASDRCALFAVTTGEALCAEITQRFQSQDFALGSMLDAAASEGTERTADALEGFYRTHIGRDRAIGSREGLLRFSPGYCGWHVSGQKRLFDLLRPADIGISLNESCLMTPLKSISGVIIFGKKEIFAIDDRYSFCRDCADHACQDRFQALMSQ